MRQWHYWLHFQDFAVVDSITLQRLSFLGKGNRWTAALKSSTNNDNSEDRDKNRRGGIVAPYATLNNGSTLVFSLLLRNSINKQRTTLIVYILCITL